MKIFRLKHHSSNRPSPSDDPTLYMASRHVTQGYSTSTTPIDLWLWT